MVTPDAQTWKWERIFDLGLVLKIVSGALEIAGGLLVLLVSRAMILRIADIATAGELARDPDDFIATSILGAAHTFAVHAHYVLAIYLLLRGLVKVGLAGLILRGAWYAYPLFIVALGIFGSYEAYRAVVTSNLLLGGVALFDTALILLTADAYSRKQGRE